MRLNEIFNLRSPFWFFKEYRDTYRHNNVLASVYTKEYNAEKLSLRQEEEWKYVSTKINTLEKIGSAQVSGGDFI